MPQCLLDVASQAFPSLDLKFFQKHKFFTGIDDLLILLYGKEGSQAKYIAHNLNELTTDLSFGKPKTYLRTSGLKLKQDIFNALPTYGNLQYWPLQ